MEQRLAAATAIPPSQRSPEVAAFIECCQLQRELAEEQQQDRSLSHQEKTLAALKLTASHFLSPTLPLLYRPAVYTAALEHLLCAAQPSAQLPNSGVVSTQCIKALVDSDFSIHTLLLLASAAPAIGWSKASQTRMLPVYNSIVDRMQRPTVAACLRQELEQLQMNLPRRLLSYQQLLARFVRMANLEASSLHDGGDNSMAADIEAAFRCVTTQ